MTLVPFDMRGMQSPKFYNLLRPFDVAVATGPDVLHLIMADSPTFWHHGIRRVMNTGVVELQCQVIDRREKNQHFSFEAEQESFRPES
jgi:hypothetical protein